MKTNFSDKLYETLIPKIIESDLLDFWLATHYDESGVDIEESISFDQRRDIFLWILERLLTERRIKLHKNRVLLEIPIEKQIELFRSVFPKNRKDADRICTKPKYDVPYEDFGMNVWWFMDDCPAGVAWRREDGHYEIAD